MAVGLLRFAGAAAMNRFTLGALAGMAGLAVYLGTKRPDRAELDPRLTRASETVLARAVSELPAGDNRVASGSSHEATRRGVQTVVVLPLEGDNTLALTDRLRELVAGDGRFSLTEGGRLAKIARKLDYDLPSVATVTDAATWGERLGADLVLWGKVDHWRIAADGKAGELALALSLVETASKTERWRKAYDSTALAVGRPERGFFASLGIAAAKVAIWFLATVLLPLIGWPFVRKVLDNESNAWNFVLVVVLTLVSTAVAWALMGFAVPDTSGVVTLVLAALAGLWFHYRSCSMLEDQRSRETFMGP